MLNLIPPLALALGLLRYHVVAQQATCLAGYTWMYNSLQQDPCLIGAKLGAVCNGGTYTIFPLAQGQVYTPPPAQYMTRCICNTVFYSLFAACSVCQGQNFTKFSAWTPNCIAVYSKEYPANIPDDTAVPHYAYLDVITDDTFDLERARAAGGPESTVAARPTDSSTLTASSTKSTTTPTTSSTIAKKTNVGAIIGGVIGAVVGSAILGVSFFLLCRRLVPLLPKEVQH